jgi:hypothetical protein
MKNLVLGMLMLLGVSQSALAESTHGTFTASIRSVSVITTGEFRSDDRYGQQTAADCAKFKLPNKAALKWFRRSKEVEKETWNEALDWTQCSASGTLKIANGNSYHWHLDQSGRGQIIVTPSVSVYLSGKELPFSKY